MPFTVYEYVYFVRQAGVCGSPGDPVSNKAFVGWRYDCDRCGVVGWWG